MMIFLPVLPGTVLFQSTIQRRGFIYRTGIRCIISIRGCRLTFYHIRKNELSSVIWECNRQPFSGDMPLGIIFLIHHHVIIMMRVSQDRLLQTSQTIIIVYLILPCSSRLLSVCTCSYMVLVSR